jgi:deoxyribose-phosphate aldolase
LSVDQTCSVCGTQTKPFTYDGANELISFGASRVGAVATRCPPKAELAKWIDHTVLKPDTTEEVIRTTCQEANQYGFASVCINPTWVPLVYKLLHGHTSKICTVIGFPLGATLPEVKAMETRLAVEKGADEIDMVMNIGALKSGNYELVERDIRAVVRAAGRQIVKVIIETCLLTDEEKVKASAIAQRASANFVKTSTGFSSGGATVKDVALMRKVVGSQMGVKASGGVRTYDEACKMVEAGATRIGASASVAIVGNNKGKTSDY